MIPYNKPFFTDKETNYLQDGYVLSDTTIIKHYWKVFFFNF